MNFTSIKAYLLIIPMSISACSPEPVLRLQPDHNEDDITIYRGMKYLYSEAEHSAVVLAYYRHHNQMVIMDLEVINYSDEPVRFDASDFLFRAYRLKFEWEDDIDQGEIKPQQIAEGTAYDPEDAILAIDIETSKAEARNRTNSVLEGISGTLYAIDDLSTIGRSQSTGERAARDMRRTRLAIERAERREHFYSYSVSLNEQRIYWETSAIRTTDLLPGDSIAGEVSFPIVHIARLIEIEVQVGEDSHHFKFLQERHDS